MYVINYSAKPAALGGCDLPTKSWILLLEDVYLSGEFQQPATGGGGSCHLQIAANELHGLHGLSVWYTSTQSIYVSSKRNTLECVSNRPIIPRNPRQMGS